MVPIDVNGFGHPIRVCYYGRKRGEVMPVMIRSQIDPDNVCGIYDELCVIRAYPRGDLIAKVDAIEAVKIACKPCGDPSRLFIGELVIRGSTRRMSFDENGNGESERVIAELLVRAYGYEPLPMPAAYFLQADPEIEYGARKLGTLKEIIRRTLIE